MVDPSAAITFPDRSLGLVPGTLSGFSHDGTILRGLEQAEKSRPRAPSA